MPENMHPNDETIDLIEYLEIVGRRKMMILKVTISVFLLSIIVVLLLPKIFAATTRILPPQQDQGLASLMMSQMGGGMASLAGNLLGSGSPGDQYASMLQSERIMDTIIDRFKLMDEYDMDYRLDMYEKMDKIVDIDPGKKDGIITITVEDEDPKKAADIANAYIDELGKLVAEMNTTMAGLNRGFLENRLAQSRADLARAEDALKSFQTKYKALDVPSQAKASIEGIAQLTAQLAMQEAQLSSLRSQFTDSAREVINVKATIGNLRSQIARLEGIGTGAIPSVGSVPGLGQEQIRLLREFKTQEMLVELLTKQNELAKLTEAKNINTIQVIQRAVPPDKKVKPKRALIVVIATILAFFGSVVWALLKDYAGNMTDEDRMRWARLREAFRWKSINIGPS
jgi:tyrosine-protein kinase Etk/Wzc